MLPRVKINYLNGLLGTVSESEDGLLALVNNGAAVAQTFALETPYTLTSYDDLTALGITSSNNPAIEKMVREFYEEPNLDVGTKVVIIAYANTETMSTLCDPTTGKLKTFISSQNGKIRGLVIGRNPASGYNPVTTDGLDADVFTAMPKAQALAEWAANTLFAPIFIVLEGRALVSASALKDISSGTCNRVMIFIGDTVSDSDNAAIGALAGRIAAIPVQRSIARVKDGPLYPSTMYIGTTLVENAISDITTINDKGYVSIRSFVGKIGYYFTDDKMAVAATDDYARLANRRVIDKAARIVYKTMINELNDEIEINSDGTMQPGIIKHIQEECNDAIDSEMTAYGNLSAKEGESGSVCFIDASQNVLSTSQIEITLKVKPFGYAKDIIVNLGFEVTT